MGPSSAGIGPPPQVYTPPATTDPSVIKAGNDAAAAAQSLRGRGATLLVTPANSGADLLPKQVKGTAALLGGGTAGI